jgi:hypothetical protein
VLCFEGKLDETVVASINGEEIRETELFFYLNKYGKSSDEFKGEDGKRKLLDKLLEFKMMLVVSKKYGGEKDPIFIINYKNHLKSKYAELLRKKIADSITVTQDDVDIEFVESGKNDKRRPKEQIAEEKKELKKILYFKKYEETLKEELKKLRDASSINIDEDILDSLDKGESVEADAIVFEVNDEKISYKRLGSLIPQDVRHSPKDKLRKKEFLNKFIAQEIEAFLLAKEAERLGLGESDIYFHLNNKEYYEKMLVNMLDYNKEFINDVYGHVQVSDEEIEDYYNENKSKLGKHETLLKVARLVFNNGEDARAAFDELKKGIQTKDVAEKYLKKLKDAEWDMGYISKKKLNEKLGEKLGETVLKLEVGRISSIIINDAYIVVKIDDEKKDVVAPLDDIKDSIRKMVKKEKSQKAFGDYIKKLKKEANISIDEVLLQKITLEQ